MVLARCRKMPVFQKNKPGADVAFCHLGVAFLDEPKHIANVDFTPRAPRPRYRQIQLQGDWTRANTTTLPSSAAGTSFSIVSQSSRLVEIA